MDNMTSATSDSSFGGKQPAFHFDVCETSQAPVRAQRKLMHGKASKTCQLFSEAKFLDCMICVGFW